MTIGKTVTRSGIPVLQLPPDAKFITVTWGQLGNTRTATSPTTQFKQVNYMPGLRWTAKFGFRKKVGCSDLIGEIRAWMASLRGAAKPFFISDPSRCNQCRLMGKSKSVTKTVTLAACCVGDGLWAADDLWPADDLWLPGGNGPEGWPEYVFTLAVSFDAQVPLVVSGAALNGATTLGINSLDVDFSVTNDNPWDYSTGARTGYADALNETTAELIKELGYFPGDQLLKAGDWIQVEDNYVMLTQGVTASSTSISFEPPLKHPVAAGVVIDYESPGVIMSLVDDNQVNWTVSSKTIHESISFEAVEWIE